MNIREEIFADYEAVTKHCRPATWPRVAAMFVRCVNFRAVSLYRLGHRAHRLGLKVFAYLLETWILGTGAEISLEAEIGGGLYLAHLAGVVIGNKTKIGRNAYILQGVTLGGNCGRERDGQTQPMLGDNVLIAAGAKVLGPVRIGNNVEIGANAVVLDDLPDESVAVGVPARVIRVGGRRVPLLDRDGEQSELLRDLVRRVESLERQLSEQNQSAQQ
jgi:serine O-acetyltransferase